MRRKTYITIGLVFLAFLIGYFLLGEYSGQEFFSEGFVKNNTSKEPAVSETQIVKKAFDLQDINGDFSFTSEENFNFNLSQYEIIRPVSKDIISGIAEMQLYFGANEARRVEVIGLYISSEKNNSNFPNLGMARANAIKEFLIIQGIPSSRIDLKGELRDLKPYKKILYGPVDFKIHLEVAPSE